MKQKNIVLMVVAVGCGLVAAFLTSQMSAKPAAVERVDVIVAAKDLTVGTSYTKEDLAKVLKRKSVARDAVPQGAIEAEEELLEKRLNRTIRAEEMINKADLTKGVFVDIPPGKSMVSLPINLQNSVHGFVLPHSKVDVIASVTLNNKVRVLPILVNMLVLAVDANTQTPNGQGTFQSLSTVSFAVSGEEALLIQLARARHCEMTLVLRNKEDKVSEYEKGFKIEEVVRLLQNGEINDPANGESDGKGPKEKEPTTPAPAPTPKIEVVKVPAAAEDIPAGTQLTKDLIGSKFKLIELPKDLAADAVTDLEALADEKQTLRTGLGKGQWITKSLIGSAAPKPAPPEAFEPTKPGPAAAKNIRVITRHTASRTTEFRYEEVAPGEWKFLGEFEDNKLVEKDKERPKPTPSPTPEKVD